MYLGVDVGGTKTLLAVFTQDGQLKQTYRFETPATYPAFLQVLCASIQHLEIAEFSAACIAVPGEVNRAKGIGVVFGNLPWKNVPIAKDLKAITSCPVYVENDAKLAGLFEAHNLKGDYNKVLYITISTGIGTALITNGIIDTSLADPGGGGLMIEHRGKTMTWDSLASGKAIVKRYGKRASDINDPHIWRAISEDIARGLIDVISLVEPDVVVIGGGVGTHFKKYHTFLAASLKDYHAPMVKLPPLKQASRPEEAVIYGCYEFIKSQHA